VIENAYLLAMSALGADSLEIGSIGSGLLAIWRLSMMQMPRDIY
jgi:hypothetical protein